MADFDEDVIEPDEAPAGEEEETPAEQPDRDESEGEGETEEEALPTPAPVRPSFSPSSEDFLSTVRRLENSGDQAVSPKGAVGRYQIMPATAQGLGFDPQDRFDPAKNEQMAGLLRDQLDKQYGGDRDAMLVAYNAGPKTADKWLAADRDNSVLPQETQKYLTRAGSIQATPQLPAVFDRAAQARAGGYSWDEIDSYLANARAQAKAGGYGDAEINDYLGLPAPKDMATARGQLLQRGYKPEEVDGLIHALTTAAEPTASDVLRPQGWSVEGATQFFGQKVVNGIHAALESQDGKPKTKEDEDRLKAEMAPAAAAFTAAPYAEGDPNLSLEDLKNMGKGAVAAIAGFPGDMSALAAWGGSLIGLKSQPMLPTTGKIEQAMGAPDNERGKLYQTLGEFSGGMVAPTGPTGLAKSALKLRRQMIPTVKDALDAAVSITKGGTEGDLNAAFQAIGQHYLETGTHPLDAAYQAQSDPSLAAKLGGESAPRPAAADGNIGIPIHRVVTGEGPITTAKPQGLYVSVVDDTGTFESPHADEATGARSGYLTPRNPLEVNGDTHIEHARFAEFRGGPGSAGVLALKELSEPAEFATLMKANKQEVIAHIHQEFPDVGTARINDAYEGLEILGAQRAKAKGYDAIISRSKEMPNFSEAVALNDNIVHLGKTTTEDIARFKEPEPSLAAKVTGKLLGDESGALRIGPEEPEFPYPREAPELPINVTSIQKQNPAVSNGVIDAFRKAFSPYNRGQEAADTAAVLREGLAKVAADYNSASYTLRDFGRSVGELTPAQKMDFVHAFETGDTAIFKNTPLGDLAGEIHSAFEQRYAAMEKRGIVDSYVQNYITHLWRDPVAAGKFYAQRPMAGSRLFTNQRVYATYREGMANGLVPLTTNPIEMALTGLHQMDRAIAAHDMMSELSARGLVRGVPFGERLGFGEIPIDDRIARPNVAGEEGHRYVAQEPVATIVNRAFSPGLGGNAIYQKIRSGGNMLNSAQLGLSGFHLGFVTADAFTSSVAQGVKQISRLNLGEAAQGVKSIVTAPAAPFRNLIAGWKVWNQALGLKDYGPEVKSIADALIAGGGRLGMERQYAGSSAYGSFFRAFKGEVQKAAGEETGNMTLRQEFASMMADARASATTFTPAMVRFAGAMIPRIQDTIMAPLMEYYVPAMKAGTFANLMRDELRVNPNMDRMTLRQTAGRVWNSVDNRLGQFVYDNLFWDKTLKDIGHVGVRSLGWNLGTIRELAGGMASLKDGRKITAGEFHQITDAASYVLALPITTAMMGATWGFLHGTWNSNWGIKDYLFPPTGGKADKRGDPERASMPGYMKDAIEWSTHPLDTALSKRHPLFDLVWQMMNNEQWNGAGIYDPRPGKETTLQKAGDYAKFLAEQFEPIMVKSQLPPGTKIPLWENFFGVKPAPHAVREVLGEKPTEHEQQVVREKGAQKVRMDREKK